MPSTATKTSQPNALSSCRWIWWTVACHINAWVETPAHQLWASLSISLFRGGCIIFLVFSVNRWVACACLRSRWILWSIAFPNPLTAKPRQGGSAKRGPGLMPILARRCRVPILRGRFLLLLLWLIRSPVAFSFHFSFLRPLLKTPFSPPTWLGHAVCKDMTV